jgi:metallo-beta-lactamase class B
LGAAAAGLSEARLAGDQATIERLRRVAGARWADAVHFWCEEPRANRPDDPPIPPTKIFDDVFAIGNSSTTVYVIRTARGLLMIDALAAGDAAGTTAQLESQLLPGFQKLGLDPALVKIVLVTHGHADHFGGASYFQEHYGSKVYVSAADWNLIENAAARGRAGRGSSGPPPGSRPTASAWSAAETAQFRRRNGRP